MFTLNIDENDVRGIEDYINNQRKLLSVHTDRFKQSEYNAKFINLIDASSWIFDSQQSSSGWFLDDLDFSFKKDKHHVYIKHYEHYEIVFYRKNGTGNVVFLSIQENLSRKALEKLIKTVNTE